MTVAPPSSNFCIASRIGSVSPAITVIFGEFLFAAITYPSTESNTDSITSYGAVIEAIIPLSGTSTLPISVPLAAAALRASSNRNIPDTINAAYSPRLCPATISG